MRRLLSALLCVSLMLALAGCSFAGSRFIELVEGVENVATVQSSGGGYSDSVWVVEVTPVAGLSDAQLVVLAGELNDIRVQWDDVRPGSLRLALGSFGIEIGDGTPGLEERIAAWVIVRSDSRINEGFFDETTSLLADTDDVFALAREFATLPAGITVDDFVGVSDWSLFVRVDPACLDAIDRLDAIEPTVSAALVSGTLDSADIAPCATSALSAASKRDVLDLSDQLYEAFAAAGLTATIGLVHSSEEVATRRTRSWIVSLESYSPEIGAVLRDLSTTPEVVALDLWADGTLRVSLADGEDLGPVEDLIEQSDANFSAVVVGYNL